LFIAIDDLRNDLGVYGVAHAQTPALDAFARSARPFSRHYVQVPTCGASRCALLRGKYPEEAEHVGNNGIVRTHARWGEANLPAWFLKHGYQTLALGKITHYPGGRTGKLWAEGPEELPGSWTRSWIPETPWGAAQNLMHGYANGEARIPGESPPWESFDGPDHAYPDAYVADEAVDVLKKLAAAREKKPWFFAVGFFKPHLPFAAPRRWHEAHPPESLPLPNSAADKKPKWPSTWHGSGEFRGNYGHATGLDPAENEASASRLRQAYAACVSYVDAQVGKVLASLKEEGLEQDTVVMVWSDHGFLLGEHGVWGKHCLFEQALKSPLLIRYPGLVQPGSVSPATVESVDVFPTLTDLCGLPTPAGLHGRSLRPQLEDAAAPSVKPASSYWTQGRRTLRDDRWRLIVPGGAVGDVSNPPVELYDYENDPDETMNHAEARPEVVKAMLARLAQLPRVPAAPAKGRR
jgi:iduronate 2-sulfatase